MTLNAVKTALIAGVALMGASVAHADPITLYYSFDNSNYSILAPTTTTGTNGTALNTVVTNGATGQSFGVQFSATGSGSSLFSLAEPSFDTQSITVSASTGGLIYLVAIESGITDTNVTSFNIGYTNNTSSVSVGERFFVGQTVTPSTMSSSAFTLAPLTTQSDVVSAAGLTSGYSVGERYRVDFGAATGSINATISERGNVPEPMSIALLGSGLVGFGLIRRKRA
jgi:hypothetical protein